MNNIDQYDEKLANYQSLEQEVKFIITEFLKDNKIKYERIESRIKTKESFLDKIERKNYVKPFEEMRDILGVRIIFLFLSDLKSFEKDIRTLFDIIEVDNKILNSEVNQFGYSSIHFIAKLNDECTGPRYDKIKSNHFEIQIRTLAMHSWANISHHLNYKKDADIPQTLMKDFYALSGLFHIADKLFEEFYELSLANHQDIIKKDDMDSILNMRLDLDSLSAYLLKKFPDRKHSSSKAVSELLDELIGIGINSIDSLNNRVDMCLNVAMQYEEKYPSNKGAYADVGMIRQVLSIYGDDYLNYRKTNDISRGIFVQYRSLVKDLVPVSE